jgi:hypothetical protein
MWVLLRPYRTFYARMSAEVHGDAEETPPAHSGRPLRIAIFVTTITSSGEELRHNARVGGESAMKAISVSILAFAIIAASVISYQAAAKPRWTVFHKPRTTVEQAEEPCIGLSCLPPDLPMKHRPAHRQTLQPVW